MFRPTLALIAATLPASALAQTTPNDPTSPPENAIETAPAPTEMPKPPAIPAAPARTASVVVDPDRIVALEFPRYDTDGVPGLSPGEFTTWVAQLFANAGRTAPTPDYPTAAFAQADVNKDGVLEQGEFAAFLKGG